jgi:uncharacterized protein YndB with AHSA1/START domain
VTVQELDSDTTVRKSITVKATPEKAFRVFTDGIDTWWPRTHHIGKSPMTKAILEGGIGGRCYSKQEDGTECEWGSILVWDPPRQFVMAWRINTNWEFEPDLAKSSEVYVRFTQEADGFTRVDLEHWHLERMGGNIDAFRSAIDSPGGWSGLLALFGARADTGISTAS